MELVQTLRELGVGVRLDGRKLLIDAPQGILHDQLLKQIKSKKNHLIKVIKLLNKNHPYITQPSLGFKLSSAQEQLWTISKFEEGANSYYNVVVTLAIRGNLRTDLFESAIIDLIRRHESLRTLFINVDNHLVQIVLPDDEAPISIEKLRFLNQDHETSFEELVETERRYSFDLEQGPLFRVKLVAVSDNLHYFVMTMHHIICDGISFNIIKRDLSQLYLSRVKGNPTSLPELPFQFKDYVSTANASYERHKNNQAFWKSMFKTGVPYLNLPTDFEKSELPTFKGAAVRDTICEDDFSSFRDFCNQTNSTLYVGLFALMNALMYLNSGQNHIVLGTITSGRSDTRTSDLVGLFVNTLAVRIDFSPEEPFNVLLDQVKGTLLKVLKHQDYPFSSLVDYLRNCFPGVNPPLFEVMVLLHNHAEAERTFLLDGLEVEDLDYRPYNGNFPFTFNFTEINGGLDINLEYNTDLFHKETAEILLLQFRTILQFVAAYPETKVKDLEYLDANQKVELKAFFSGPVKPLPKEETLVNLFYRQCELSQDKLALKFQNNQYTYSQLWSISTAMATDLITSYGLKKNQLVPIIAVRSDQLTIAILGILCAGAGYVPIEPDLPPNRIQYILNDINAENVIVQSRYYNLVEGSIANLIVLEDELKKCSKTAIVDFVSPASPESIAYMIYTSGSSGVPKGAMIHHQGMLNHLLAKKEDLQLDSQSIIAQTAPISFDISVWQMVAALIFGGTTVVYESDVVNDPKRLCNCLLKDRITILEIVPSYIALLLEFGAASDFRHLKYLIATGEALPYNLLGTWLAEHPNIPMVNAYGPTEVSDDVTHQIYHEVPRDENVSIGSPIRNLSIYVVDDWGTLMPVGVKGQIVVSGVGVGMGYFNNPEKTAKVFGVDHYFNGTQRKTYATGDIGIWCKDGTLQYLGRMDDQVKIRGYRIELGEIEKNIARFEAINQVAVCVKNNDKGGLLIAFLTLKESSDGALENTKSNLSSHLPEYMVPHHWIVLDKMPLTNNGKIDRKRLNEYELGEIESKFANSTSEISFTEKENKVYEEWCAVLDGTKHLSLTDNFFAIGGDSFKAILLAARLSKKFNTQFSIKDIFVHNNIRSQAQQLTESKEQSSSIQRQEIKKDTLQLSDVQVGIFNQHQVAKESSQYNITGAFEVSGSLDPDRVVSVFETLVKRHGILRTSFVIENNTPVQKIHKEGIANVYKVAENDPIIHLNDQPLDLSTYPLFHVILVEEGRNVKRLIFEAHHIIFDGLSIDILMQEFITLYRGESLAEEPLQYTDYLLWSQQSYFQERLRQQEKYWLDAYQSRKVELLELPLDYESSNMEGSINEVMLQQDEYDSLSAFCQDHQLTPSNFLLSAYIILLYKYSGQKEIALGIPVTGRLHQDMFQILGPFANLIPFVSNIDETKDILTWLLQIQNESIEAFSNQDFSFSDLVKKTKIRFSSDFNSLFNGAFSSEYFNKSYRDSLSFSLGEGVYLNVLEIPETSDLKYRIHMRTYIYNDTIRLRLEYRTKLFTKGTIDGFITDFKSLLKSMILMPQAKIGEIDLIAREKAGKSVFDDENTFNF